MNEVIDVNYKTEVNLESKSTEQLTAEVNAKYWQAEGLAHMSYMILADAGRRLIEIKSRIPHGKFEDWCTDNLEFSKSKAEKCMKLARKMDDENSLFSKTETFTDIEISTVWALLAAPEEVAAEVIENNDVADMTVRELKEKIAQLKKEKEEAEARADAASLDAYSGSEQELADMQHSVEHLNDQLKAEQDKNTKMTSELSDAKEKLKKEKVKVKELKDAQEEEVKKAIDAAEADIREKAKIDAAAEVHATLGQNAEEINRLEAEVEALEKKLANNSNELLMQFKVYMDELQDTYFKINDLISEQNEIDEEVGTKMAAALQKIIGEWRP